MIDPGYPPERTTSRKPELAINLRSARALGLEIPPMVLADLSDFVGAQKNPGSGLT